MGKYLKNQQSLFSLKLFIFNFHATNTIILSFLPLYLKHKGLTGTEIGWVLAIGPFATIISQPFWGYVSDKYKTVKKILIISIIGMLIMSMLFFSMGHLVTILIFGALFYFFSSPIGAFGDSLAQRRADELHISFGSIRMWGSIGFGLSSLLIGELLTKVGIGYIVWPYVILGSFLLVIAFTLKDVVVEEDPIQLIDVKKLFTNRPFIFFLGFMMFVTIAHRANDSYIGIYIQALGGTESLVGLAWFVGLVSEAIIFATAHYWFRNYHTFIFILIASFIYIIRWFIYGSIHSVTAVIPLQILHGLSFGVFYTAALDYVTRVVPNVLQSTGHLIFYSVFFGVSGIIGSLFGGMIMDAFSVHTLYIGMAFFTLIGFVVMSIYYIAIKRAEI